MAEIKPRWEWRSFGRRFGEAEARLAQLTPGGVQESDEIYLLSGAGDNVKVRDALMDIKVLREVDANGLEQWTPVMKAGFPLPAAEAARVLESLHLPVPPLSRASFSLDEFIEQFAGPGGAIRAVKVHKRRTRYTFGGCMAELSDVVANGKPTRTIAVESEDAAAVIGAVRELGLGGYLNTSYPVGLAALIDGLPTRYAVIDAGTNSIKFHIAERDLAGRWRTLVDRAELTRLGEGLAQQGGIIDAALERAVVAIAGMADEAKRHSVRALAAVGTAGLRIAANGSAIVAAIEARTGVHIDVISGEEEGRLAYLAAKSGLGLKSGALVVFDTGGGSSQFTFGQDERVDDRFSVDVGAVRYTERFGLDGVVSPDTLREAISSGAERYRGEYTAYYHAFATPQSPRLRDPNPSVVLVPGIGMFAFGANSREARYTAEFYRNAIRVMAGASALGGGRTAEGPLSQPKSVDKAAGFDRARGKLGLRTRWARWRAPRICPPTRPCRCS